jgi:hypothetical protein
MKVMPLLVRCAEATRRFPQALRDQTAFEDELPAVLDRDASGYIRSGKSKLTEVNRETTDDR